jgi:hypothetical protein
MAERVLSPEQLEDIYKRFEAHEEKVIGHGRHEQLHAWLHDLEQKYSLNCPLSRQDRRRNE